MRRLVLLALVFLAATRNPQPETRNCVLGVEGTQFTINGQATFLLGISYYAALGAPNELCLRDLDQMQKHGFNWIRVWATWAHFDDDVAAVDAEGKAREPQLSKLRWLIEECNRRGMIVDVTFSRGKGRLDSPHALQRGVETVVGALKPYRNWYLDLANERNIKDQRYVSFEELAESRKLVKRLDPSRLVTASHAGDIGREELRRYLHDVEVDFLTPHRPRRAGSPEQTAAQTKTYLAGMKELGRVVPVHYQEPFRRGFEPKRWEPTAGDFLADLRGAREGKAAGWCFHNGDQRDKPDGRPRRSFDLRDGGLFDHLDDEEAKFLGDLK